MRHLNFKTEKKLLFVLFSIMMISGFPKSLLVVGQDLNSSDPLKSAKWEGHFTLSRYQEEEISDGGLYLWLWDDPDVPPDAEITNVHYSIVVDDNEFESNFYPSDYVIEFYSEGTTFTLWDREGTLASHTDDGNDDDTEDDTDIDLDGYTDIFNGESADQIFSVLVDDENGFGGEGRFISASLTIYWEASDPNLSCISTPEGWDNAIVVNHSSGSFEEADVLYANTSTYLKIAVTNTESVIPAGLSLDLWYSVDGGETAAGLFSYDGGLLEGGYHAESIELVFTEGEHEICQIVDLFDIIPETSEVDNEYCITRVWIGPPDIPVLSAPVNEDSDQPASVHLSWNASPTATLYLIQVDDDSDFSSPMIDGSSAETSMDITGLTVGTTYYWRVMASNSAGNSLWSDEWHFTCSNPDAISDAKREEFCLGQNRPNPFTEYTDIELNLPSGGELIFELTDLQGKIIKSFSGYYHAGVHILHIDLEEYVQPGVYIYRITGEEYTGSKICIVQ